jgi:tetratricopeptide (TPR) repeat protein
MNGREGYSDPLAEARQHLEQAYAYEERDEFENALRECELAIQLAPGLAELHNLRGIVLEELGRKREAIAAYREAVRLDPAFREAQENLSEAEAELREERQESPKVEVAHQLEVLACSVCGRQDETLRAVVYPYVFSLVIVTFRRAFAGLWCRKHRNLRLVLASLITATIGWIGIPFGFFFTPVALFKLARGGDQPAELNANMLRALAENKLQEGDAKGAVRCLEASLQFHDDDTARERLRELRMNFGLPVYEGGCQRVVLTIAGILLVAVLIGAAIGVLDYVITAVFSSLLGGEVLIYVVILSWAPFVAMAFIGGLILFQLIEWALARIKCRRLSIAISIGIVTAVLATYSLLQGSAMSDYVTALLSDGVFESVLDAIFTGILVLLLGGVFWILGFTEPANTSEAIYIVLLLVIGIYYSIMAVLTAIRTTRWQQRLIT